MMKKEMIPKILINSVPKSGTNLLLQIISGIPNINRKETSALFQLRSGEFVTGHFPYKKEFSDKLRNHLIKHVFIYRDPRDVTVSLRHFINNKFPDHPLHFVFKNRLLTREEQFQILICGTKLIGNEINNKWGLQEYPANFKGFRRIYLWQKDPSINSIRYEDLVGNENTKEKVIDRMINYLWEDLGEDVIDKNQIKNKMKQSINPGESWTFRKGIVGGWKKEFSERNKEDFKEAAGDLLIELGYEKDFNW